jgi:peptidyl-tRNA hydrolase, PTH1 family
LKYLIVGLGNIGDEYLNTRHNIGFEILDAFAGASNISFNDKRYAYQAETSFKGKRFILVKPTTFVNLSGKAVNYWLQKEKIEIQNLLVIVDDIALPFGTFRMRAKGGDGGHNGLLDISSVLGTQDYARLRFGIGKNFQQGAQVDYVLGKWSVEEKKVLPAKLETAIEIIRNFALAGLGDTMTRYNR